MSLVTTKNPSPQGKRGERKVMSKKEVAKVFNEEKVQKLVESFNTNVTSAVKNVTKNCILLANATDGDFTEAKNRLVESQGLSGGAISQMRGAGVVYRQCKSINDISYTKVYEIARFNKATDKLEIEKKVEVMASLVDYVQEAMDCKIEPTSYSTVIEAVLRSGISNKELKIAVDCALEDAGLKKIKTIEKKPTEDTTEDSTEDTSKDTSEDKDIPEMVVYMSFLGLGDSEKIEFLKMLKDDKYIDRIASNWKK